MSKLKQIVLTIFVILFILFIICGSTVLLMSTHTYQTPLDTQEYDDYVIYINRNTHEIYTYEQGHFIPLYGADGEPLIINIEK